MGATIPKKDQTGPPSGSGGPGDGGGPSARERLASLAHEQWSGWMEYLFSKCVFNLDGTATIPKWAVERWQRQMNTIYSLLDEQEKESDRREAEKMIACFRAVANWGD